MTSATSGDRLTEPVGDLPVYRQVDVLVCGGGTAGVAAAVAAARNGAEVLLLERDTTLGGSGPRAFLTEFHEAYFVGGVMREVIDRLREAGGADPNLSDGHFAVPYDPEVLKAVLWEIVEGAGAQALSTPGWPARSLKTGP